MAEKKITDRIDLDRIVDIFDLPSLDKIEESNFEYVHDAGDDAAIRAREDGDTEKQIEKARDEAEQAAQEDIYGNYHNAVTSAADQIFAEHHLELVPARKGEKYPFEFKIQPMTGKTWGDAAKQLATTINGVGLTYEDPSEYTKAPKSYVLSRLSWVNSYPEVYGTASAGRIYERSWR